MLVSLRTAARMGGFVLWTVFAAGLALLGRIVLLPSRTARARWGAYSASWWGRGCCWMAGLELVVEGPRPPPGSFVAANHVSWADIWALGAACPAMFIAKVEISTWPIMGWLSKLGSTLWIDRRRMRDTARMREELRDYLGRGVRIHMFAEGGAGDGVRIRPFRPPLFEAAAALGVPCVPAVLRYQKEDFWWPEDAVLARHFLRCLGLPRSRVLVRFGLPVTGIGDRKELAAELQRRSEELYLDSEARFSGPGNP
ncbi:MAG: 1-acyl-sn-glycerol-3-phosphate acyltransferase [Planctomycetes bacterium]|nr:1-acyl-sn-glycerol-3-phosphate acyltransferase [Planctomycetota bacterium]